MRVLRIGQAEDAPRLFRADAGERELVLDQGALELRPERRKVRLFVFEESCWLTEGRPEGVDPLPAFLGGLPELARPGVTRQEGEHGNALLAGMGELQGGDRLLAVAAFVRSRHPAAAEGDKQHDEVALGQALATHGHGWARVGAAVLVQELRMPVQIEHHVARRLAPGLQVFSRGGDEDAEHLRRRHREPRCSNAPPRHLAS